MFESVQGPPVKVTELVADGATGPRRLAESFAVYDVILRLDREPSIAWQKHFLKSWESRSKRACVPPRVCISVHEGKIVLGYTTTEEARDLLDRVLKGCIAEANRKEGLSARRSKAVTASE